MSTQDDNFNELLENLGDPGTRSTAGERGEAREDSDGDAEDEETQQRFRSSILLEDMLDKKDYKQFKEKLNLPSNLEDNDDLKIMCDMASTNSSNNNNKGLSGAKVLYKNLFNVLCCLAGESVSKVGMDSTQQIIDFNVRFQFWSEDIAKTEEFSSNLLRFFPGRELPRSFFDYVKTMRSTPTPKFIKDNKLQHLSVEQQAGAKFGAVVKSHFDSCKREINSTLNRLWIPASKLPSGVSCYAYLYFMRKQLWPTKAFELAEMAMKTGFKRDNSTAKYNKKDHVVTISEKAAAYEFHDNWYPDYWLAFLYLGLPAGDKVRPSFASGEATVVQSLPAIRSMANKATRRAIDGGSATGPSSSTKKSKRNSPDTLDGGSCEKKFVLTLNSGQYDPLNALIANLKDQAATMVNMDVDTKSPEYRSVMAKLLKAQQAAMEKIEKEIDDSVFTTPL